MHRFLPKTMNMPWLLLALFGLAAAWSGCYYDNELELYGIGQMECDSIGTFADNVKPILDGNCSISGCHVPGGTGPGLFENYDQVKSFVDNGRLEERVLVQRNMPPTGPLTNCQLQLIQTWIDAGAPDN